MSIHFFGIRHHGPGCARALASALEELQPDIILLEGPPEAEDIIPLAADAAMIPPVALLVYPQDKPQHGVFYPFAEFSPEWIAIRFAAKQAIPLKMMDLPLTHRFAEILSAEEALASQSDQAGEDGQLNMPSQASDLGSRIDPLSALSRAAGYDDEELWWEIEVEQRRDHSELFSAIQEAMTALREGSPEVSLHEQQREAAMRSRIRDAQKSGYERIAIVCGAWHVPALAGKANIKHDTALLKGLPKTKLASTWVPWSADRLAYRSGYGAGVISPGWYAHIWRHPEQAGIRWVTEAARLMRSAGLDASSASVIETFRLAEALAAMRHYPMAGLGELREAMLAVLCHGEAEPLALIRQQLEIGEHLGQVPASAAAAPLQRDLELQQKRLRLKAEAGSKRIELDLREEVGRGRSRLLHRLTILGVYWGQLSADRNRTGTFRESWQLQWDPEMAIQLISYSRYGNCLDEAAGNKLCEQASQADLPELTQLLDLAVLANLPAAVSHLLHQVQNQAALATDVVHLMQALPPLVQVARYGDVRGTQHDQVGPIISGLFERITLGVPLAASSIDEDAAAALIEQIQAVQQAIDVFDELPLRTEWFNCLANLCDQEAVAPAIRGFALRLGYDRQQINDLQLEQFTNRMLSSGTSAADATAWLGGLLRGSGLLLLHHEALWRVIDEWLKHLPHDVFIDRLPLLRRAFSGFTPAERRQMGGKVRQPGATALQTPSTAIAVDAVRAGQVLPFLLRLLGDTPS
ncbi:MAG: DUF5682 family protein [Undibacterium curvum]|uniref:DUF5682 family protein n=1 Tax=Undibacterium curvum TaxID=2762294 RepID=UPI003BCD469A